jgi:phospholipase C
VVYAENRSFNNLFADYPGLEAAVLAHAGGLPAARPRRHAAAKPPPAWGGVPQVGPQTVDGVTYPNAVQYQENLPNAPFPLKYRRVDTPRSGLSTRLFPSRGGWSACWTA